MSTNVTFFLAHLQKHQKKTMAKKCYKCALWFIQKETLKEHQQKAHSSLLSRKGVKPRALPANYVMVPKSKIYHNPSAAQTTLSPPSPPELISQHKLSLVIPQNTECKECKKTILNADHYPQKFSCGSCRYITDCVHSMQQHKTKCRKSPVPGMPRNPLAAELHCVCGYASDCGNQMAKHLALCERKTAYPTAEQAQVAAVDNNSHSMLDVLGLVRKNDDAGQQQQEMEVSSAEETTDKDEDSLPPTAITEPAATEPMAVDQQTTETETEKSISEPAATTTETTTTTTTANTAAVESETATVVETETVAAATATVATDVETPPATVDTADEKPEAEVAELKEDSTEATEDAAATTEVTEPKETTDTDAPPPPAE